MDNNIFSLLDTLCCGEKSAALLIMRNGNEITVASRGNHASITCSMNRGTTPEAVANAIMDAAITNVTYNKSDKDKHSCP